MEEYEVGSQHTIWINPFCFDVIAEIVSYDKSGHPIVRTMDDGEDLTLMPGEYIFPTSEDREKLEVVFRYFEDMYGEEI